MLVFDLQPETPSPVFNDEGEIIPGITGSPHSETNTSNTCKLNIESIEEDHFGRWKCIINRDAEVIKLQGLTIRIFHELSLLRSHTLGLLLHSTKIQIFM